MLNHKVTIAIEDQVAVTHVEQTFRNHTDRPLEATYVFPLPKGASLDHFTMWVDGKEVKGEIIEAAKAREVYTSIVRRTQDPGLLEYLGNNLAQLKVFPIPAHGDQKVALSFNSVAANENGLVEYVYPLKTDGKAASTLEEFSDHGDHQVAARHRQRLQPDARHHAQAHQRQRSDGQLRQEPGASRQGFPALLLDRRQGRGPDRPDAPADFDGRRLLHHAHHAQGGDPVGVSGAARHGAGARHLGQHARRQDGAGPQGA